MKTKKETLNLVDLEYMQNKKVCIFVQKTLMTSQIVGNPSEMCAETMLDPLPPIAERKTV